MPCNQIILMSVSFVVENQATLDKAIEKLGWVAKKYTNGMAIYNQRGYLVMRLEDGEAEIRSGNEPLVNALKRAYSQVVVKETVEEFGLTFLSQSEDERQGQLEWSN